jgi:HAMP domain-containing protein
MLKIFQKFKLGTKINVLLLSIFLVVVILSGIALSMIIERNAELIVTQKALLLIETMNSVRNYTSTQINPELSSRLEVEDQFLAQTVPAYSAREVFENFRKKEEYKDFFYKEATLNPTNLRDKADQFEKEIVESFKSNPSQKQTTGFRSTPGGDIFYIARPFAISKESCLRCHSDPKLAPKSQLLTYGDKNGFGWKLNDIVGAQMISVPASQVFNEARRLKLIVIGLIVGIFILVLVLINLLLKFTIINPIKKMSQVAQRVSTGDLSEDFQHSAEDEIGVLASSLHRLKVSLELAMNMLNKEPEEQ